MRKKLTIVAMGILTSVILASAAHAGSEAKFFFRMPGKTVVLVEAVSPKFDPAKMTSTVGLNTEIRSGRLIVKLNISTRNGNPDSVEAHYRTVNDPSIFGDIDGPLPHLDIEFLDQNGLMQFTSGISYSDFSLSSGIGAGQTSVASKEFDAGLVNGTESGTKIVSVRIKYSHNVWDFYNNDYDRDEVYSL